MAMWFCWLFWEKKRKRFATHSNWDRGGLPWKPVTHGQWQTKRGLIR